MIPTGIPRGVSWDGNLAQRRGALRGGPPLFPEAAWFDFL